MFSQPNEANKMDIYFLIGEIDVIKASVLFRIPILI